MPNAMCSELHQHCLCCDGGRVPALRHERRGVIEISKNVYFFIEAPKCHWYEQSKRPFIQARLLK